MYRLELAVPCSSWRCGLLQVANGRELHALRVYPLTLMLRKGAQVRPMHQRHCPASRRSAPLPTSACPSPVVHLILQQAKAGRYLNQIRSTGANVCDSLHIGLGPHHTSPRLNRDEGVSSLYMEQEVAASV